MNLQEKALYHQIHPVKLLMDWGTTPPALYFLWRRRLLPGLLIAVGPPILASFLLMRYADLEGLKASAAGRYMGRYMTPAMQALRLAGAVVMMLGAWWRQPWLWPLGLLLVLFGWGRGLLVAHRHQRVSKRTRAVVASASLAGVTVPAQRTTRSA